MAKKNINLSVAIAVYNEAENIDACLAPVALFADEIVVVDGGSTDKTVKKARKYAAKIIRTDNPPVFHINKQKALDACRGNWILQLDADERIPGALRNEIISTIIDDRSLTVDKTNNQQSNIKHQKSIINGYFIPRKNYFWGHLMKKGGQYPDYVMRLVRRGYARFPCRSVHEQIDIKGKTAYLTHPLEHISYRTTAEYWKKSDTYTSLTASELKEEHVPVSIVSRIKYSIFKPVKTFLSLYIRHKGFMDGLPGLQFAYWSALHHKIAYDKYVNMI
jgi:glycosyltransferase involved in cell wall biosynthesis